MMDNLSNKKETLSGNSYETIGKNWIDGSTGTSIVNATKCATNLYSDGGIRTATRAP